VILIEKLYKKLVLFIILRGRLKQLVAANFEGGEDEGLSDWGLIEQIM